MLHTEAMRAALASGVRFLGLAGMTVDLMTQGAATADPQELFAITERVAAVLTAAGTARVTSPEGTDVTMDLRGRRAHVLAGRCLPDSPVACFPDGESPIAPLEESTEGTIVFLGMNPFGRLSQPVALTVEL
jgi:leucyl aminopeptidase (aminopeptidase T)